MSFLGPSVVLRKQLNQEPFDASLCDRRWSTTYYRSTHWIFSEHPMDTSTVTMTTSRHRKALYQHQKYREAMVIASELASEASESSNINYEKCIELLRELVDPWKNGQIVGLTEFSQVSKYL